MRAPWAQPLKRGDVFQMSGPSVPKHLEQKWWIVESIDEDGTINLLPQPFDTARQATLASWKMPTQAVH